MADEYHIGQVENLSAETIDFLPDLTMSDLLDGLEQINVNSADIMILGKRVNSGRSNRELGGFTTHFEDIEEIFTYLSGEYDPDNKEDSLEIFQQIFGLPEIPEKVVGFVVRPT